MIPSPPHRRPSDPGAAPRRRGGFSLVELVLAGALMAVLLGAMVSVMMVTTRAVPGISGAAPSISAAAAAVTQMADELRTAVEFSERTGTVVAFTVPDRNADGEADPVWYAWSGTPGAALVRRGRNGVMTTLLPSVQSLSFSYTTAIGPTGTEAVTAVGIVLQVGPSSETAVRTTVPVMNAPSVK
jgi:Tfp pilus assembly protein PilW